MPNGKIEMEFRENNLWFAMVEVGFPRNQREDIRVRDFDEGIDWIKATYHRMIASGDQKPRPPVANVPPKAAAPVSEPPKVSAPVVAAAPKPVPAPAPKPTVAAPAAPAQPAAPPADPAPADANQPA